MRDYMMALHQRFCKEPDCREVRKELEAVHQDLYQVLDRRGQEHLLKLANMENELLDETSLESFLSGFKLALGIAAELTPSYSFDDDEEQRACQALQGQDFLALGPHSQVNAGIETLAVDQDVAGSALSYLTALLDAGKAEIIPQHIG